MILAGDCRESMASPVVRASAARGTESLGSSSLQMIYCNISLITRTNFLSDYPVGYDYKHYKL